MKINRRQILSSIGASLASSFVRPALAYQEKTEQSVREGIEILLNATRKKRATLGDRETLFMPMGERHGLVSHPLVMQGFIKGLQKEGYRVAVGYEMEYDILAEMRSITSFRDKYLLSSQDSDGSQLLRAMMARPLLFDDGFESTQNFFRFCLAEKVPFAFNDLSMERINFDSGFDMEDPLTVAFVKALEFWQSEYFSHPRNSVGVEARNAFMGLRSLAQAERHQAQIYVHHCGAAHVVGDVKRTYLQFPYVGSLTAFYRQMGKPVLPVDLTGGIQPDTEGARVFADIGLGNFRLSMEEVVYRSYENGFDPRDIQEERELMVQLIGDADVTIYDPADPRLSPGPLPGRMPPGP